MSRASGTTELSNEYLAILYESGTRRMVFRHKPTQVTFMEGPWCEDAQGGGELVKIDSRAFGKGEAIRIRRGGGRFDLIGLYPDLPFVFVQGFQSNDMDEEIRIESIDLLHLRLSLDAPANALKVLGTGGLTAPDGHSGSYVFLAVADPRDRNGVVGAWLTQDRASGVVFSDRDDEEVRIRARSEYGRLCLEPGAQTDGEIFLLGYFPDARDGLELYADLVARQYEIKLRPQIDGYCTWYSVPFGGASDQAHVLELSRIAATELKPFGFDFVQIDDMWQEGKRRNGPAKVFDRVNPKGPYPDGMKPVAERIANLGLTPGIWWMPFAGDKEDPFFADKLDWFAKKADGTPYFATWGGTSLDMTNPEARDYVAFLASRLAQEWGYKYFKMDGLWVGTATKLLYVNNSYQPDDLGEAVVHDPTLTPIEAYRLGFQGVREAAGNDVFFLGCCVSQNMRSFGASFGLVDAMRIGPDNGSDWESLKRGPWHGSNRYFLHRRVWYNDPDPVYVRSGMPLKHARLICSWVAVSGQFNVSSEWYGNLPSERMDILKRTLPNHGKFARPLDLFETEIPRVWLLQDEASGQERTVVGLFNWDDTAPQRIVRSLDDLGLDPDKRTVGFDYWADAFVPPFTERLDVQLDRGSCAVLALRQASEAPQIVSTSRHITQGVVDIVKEEWNEAEGVLQVTSRLVAGDRYEVRMVVPTGKASWRLQEIKAPEGVGVSEQDQAGPMVRVSLLSEVSLEATWEAHFEKADIRAAKPKPVTNLKASVGWDGVTLHWTSEHRLGFLVIRNDGREIPVRECQCVEGKCEPDAVYTYTVHAVGWERDLSRGKKVKVRTRPEPVLPPVPPQPSIPLTELKPVRSSTGWGKIGANQSCEGNKLTLEGTVYENGVGVHAASELVYDVPKGVGRFVAVVGLDDEKKDDPRASVVFEIFGGPAETEEGPQLLAQSPLLSNKTRRLWHFDVALTSRFRQLRLVVTDADDGNACDHADWVDAGFLHE